MKLLSAITLIMMASLMLNACLGDDDSTSDYQGLSAQEKAQCLSLVKGDYKGSMIYYATNESNLSDLIDTLDISWSIIDDSTMIVKQFPVRLLASDVTNSTLKEAIEALPDDDLECRIGFVKVSPVQFLVNPRTFTYQLTMDGASHQVQLVFLANNVYSFGGYDASTRLMEMKIIEAAIYVDGARSAYLATNTPFLFISEAKN